MAAYIRNFGQYFDSPLLYRNIVVINELVYKKIHEHQSTGMYTNSILYIKLKLS